MEYFTPEDFKVEMRIEHNLKPCDGETFQEYERRKKYITAGVIAGTIDEVWSSEQGKWIYRERD